jgi:hypothetical protein
VIWKDPWLRIIFALLVLASMTMIGTCIAIQYHWDSDVVLFVLFGFPVTVITLAYGLTLLGLASAVGLATTMWITASGKKKLHVVGERL